MPLKQGPASGRARPASRLRGVTKTDSRNEPDTVTKQRKSSWGQGVDPTVPAVAAHLTVFRYTQLAVAFSAPA